jgi:hypothetical protein
MSVHLVLQLLDALYLQGSIRCSEDYRHLRSLVMTTLPSKDGVPLVPQVFLHCACDGDGTNAFEERVCERTDSIDYFTLTADVRMIPVVTEIALVVQMSPRTGPISVRKRSEPQLQTLDPSEVLEEWSIRVGGNKTELWVHFYIKELEEVVIVESEFDGLEVVEPHRGTESSLSCGDKDLVVKEPLPHDNPGWVGNLLVECLADAEQSKIGCWDGVLIFCNTYARHDRPNRATGTLQCDVVAQAQRQTPALEGRYVENELRR